MLKSTLLYSALAAGQANAGDGFVDAFKALETSRWYVAEYDFDHPSFDTDWRRKNVVLKQGAGASTVNLLLRPHQDGPNRFAGASIRTHAPMHYGYYEATFKAARGSGLVTGFFIYSGPHYGTRHDEIDIEILGRDTTKLHAAWFVDGVLKERDIQLGFDAAQGFNTFGFHWLPDRIIWSVNGIDVFEVINQESALPVIPGRLFANLWAADKSISDWAGNASPAQTGNAVFQSIRFIPFTDLNAKDIFPAALKP
ncbi:family 16 glycosylhydrolase [Cognatishimia activa]|uniref:Beta-glucanase n=1 Tax=Cognatishimia activa TaxID=1715691 RepID=A0A0P1J3P3_9RHOB|nr:family 16 glycosylhydrolase [Cognatishimia activa]CUJ14775.1 Beta-glucanase precursor [Cognatishimia activa]CUK25006.1 Beta-glucanase precursor [Cognatishimia activa]